MIWLRRILLTVPFAIAAVLNVLVLSADRLHLHREHVAGLGFLFGAPWAWLLDRGWVPDYHHLQSSPHAVAVRVRDYSMDSGPIVFKLPLAFIPGSHATQKHRAATAWKRTFQPLINRIIGHYRDWRQIN